MAVALLPAPQPRGARQEKEPHHGLSEIPHPDPRQARRRQPVLNEQSGLLHGLTPVAVEDFGR